MMSIKITTDSLFISERLREIDLLTFQSNELFEADVKVGEEESLILERTSLMSFEKIFSLLNRAKMFLNGEDGSSGGVEAIDCATSAIAKASEYDNSYEEIGKVTAYSKKLSIWFVSNSLSRGTTTEPQPIIAI